MGLNSPNPTTALEALLARYELDVNNKKAARTKLDQEIVALSSVLADLRAVLKGETIAYPRVSGPHISINRDGTGFVGDVHIANNSGNV